MSYDGSVRTAVDLDLFGTPIRVLAELPEAGAAVRSAFADYLYEDASPVGFVLKAPQNAGGFHVLVDRSGFVLARCRSWKECVGVLTEHLVAFAKPPAGTCRVRMRSVVRDSPTGREAVLGMFPLLSLPPLVERQLAQKSLRILDRLAVDMTDEGQLMMRSMPGIEVADGEPTVGHCSSQDANGANAAAVLVPTLPNGAPSRSQLVALIARQVHSESRTRTLDLAERLASNTVPVPINDELARRRALSNFG